MHNNNIRHNHVFTYRTHAVDLHIRLLVINTTTSQMFPVLIFEDNSVGIAHESWLLDTDQVLWPKCTTRGLYAFLLREEIPKAPLTVAKYQLYKNCGTCF